ncbi:uncharacterized protein TRUGW13939_02214 [Talaromyces rugulosus]|uniref:Uncharacterized protein n=1 Tax=Talaromyces rugulosus TaxID=121627 RepID=A0A7H8QMT2_TALRU|nr:uncharacterized protein TRUGW13939_02214 [Talaromyces rugulosus]QKX55122.1 hypothetical protein TRUGW13939_02214 [Talaromyces rugulosus]
MRRYIIDYSSDEVPEYSPLPRRSISRHRRRPQFVHESEREREKRPHILDDGSALSRYPVRDEAPLVVRRDETGRVLHRGSVVERSHLVPVENDINQKSPVPSPLNTNDSTKARRGSPLATKAPTALAQDVQNVLSPSSTRDTTVHFQMDVQEDVESQLEEFSRLKRLGHFAAAEQYFQNYLAHFLPLRPVVNEYAEMLLEQGAYRRALEFLSRDLFDDDRETEGILLESMKMVATMHVYGLGRADAIQAIRWAQNLDNVPLVAEFSNVAQRIQIIHRALEIMAYASEESDLVAESDITEVYFDWHILYVDILANQAIWDLRDIIFAVASVVGPHLPGILLTRSDDAHDVPNQLLNDWGGDTYEESTYLALLDIFVVMTGFPRSKMGNIRESQDANLARQYLQHARSFANAIRMHSPDLIRSRPYLRWILAEEEFARQSPEAKQRFFSVDEKYFSRFPGAVVWRSSMPIYIPEGIENPGWPEAKQPAMPSDLLQTALKTSQELEDYQTEVLCLQELICRSPEPLGVFAQLEHLQKEVQRDLTGHQRTCLSKYLLASNDQSRRELLEKGIKPLNEYAALYSSRHCPLLIWCQLQIKNALHRSLGHDDYIIPPLEDDELLNDLPFDVDTQVSSFGHPNLARATHKREWISAGRRHRAIPRRRERSVSPVVVEVPMKERTDSRRRRDSSHYIDDIDERIVSQMEFVPNKNATQGSTSVKFPEETRDHRPPRRKQGNGAVHFITDHNGEIVPEEERNDSDSNWRVIKKKKDKKEKPEQEDNKPASPESDAESPEPRKLRRVDSATVEDAQESGDEAPAAVRVVDEVD